MTYNNKMFNRVLYIIYILSFLTCSIKNNIINIFLVLSNLFCIKMI